MQIGGRRASCAWRSMRRGFARAPRRERRDERETDRVQRTDRGCGSAAARGAPRFRALARATPSRPGACARRKRSESTTESTTPGVVDSAVRESRARVSIRPRWRGLALHPALAPREHKERNRQQIGYESTTAHLTSGRVCSGSCSLHAAAHLSAIATAGTASIDHRIDNRIDNETRPASGHDRDPPGRTRRRDPAPPGDSITCVRSGCSMSRRHGSCPCALTTARR